MEFFVVAIVMGVLVLVFIKKGSLECPKCNGEIPRFRIPGSFSQFFWGGWTCKNCNTKLNGHGKVIE